jgi:isocitrate dehydrogenase
VIPFVRGDGTGPDIWRPRVRVLDAAVEKAYSGERKIAWHEVFAGETAFQQFNNWLPDETVEAFREYLVASRAADDTGLAAASAALTWRCARCSICYVCLRPVRYFRAHPAPSSTLKK